MYIKDMKVFFTIVKYQCILVMFFILFITDHYNMELLCSTVNLTQTDELVSVRGPCVSVLCGEYPHRVRGRGAGVLHDLVDTGHDDLWLQDVPYNVNIKVNPL